MNIIVTGSAGFIGFSLCKDLLKNKKNKVFGIDNINSYYSQKLKKKRLKILNTKKNFSFLYSDINNHKKIIKYFKDLKIDYIFHFAAQAGVRYTKKNPSSYVKSNIDGFINFSKVVLEKKPKRFIFASSSSVYGDAKLYPVKENFKLQPKNLYARTKKFNEDYAYKIFKKENIKIVGLRFFTIYGEWGRPDMLIFKFLKTVDTKKIFKLNNNGEMYRDFTYIGSAVKLIRVIMAIRIKKNFEIFNICSSKPQKISSIVEYLQKKTKSRKIKSIPMNNLEVYKTYGSSEKLMKKIKQNFKYKDFKKAIILTYKWYNRYRHLI